MRSSSARSTRKAGLWLPLLAMVLLANGPASLQDPVQDVADDDGAELLAEIQTRYQSIRDFRARFEQSSRIASLDRDELSTGIVVALRPGRIRWEYREPEPRVIAIDGRAVRVWLPVDAQVQIAPLGEGTISPTALGFLLGEGDLGATFRARKIEPAQPADAPDPMRGDAGRADPARDHAFGLHLLPRSDAAIESLELWFDAETRALRESVVVDLFGNRTRLRFFEVVENGGAAEEEFTIEVPEGTEVVDLR